MDWRERFELELANAESARRRGNEGQARVCARRAAGIVAAEYYARRGLAPRTGSALDVLQQLRTDAAASANILASLDNLMLQVDDQFRLPAGVDLIAEARLLRSELFPED
jgi:hypothetical protein